MDENEITYLFFGYSSEYVLNPLYEHMKSEGFSCIEMDLSKGSDHKKILTSLHRRPVVFITSAHLFFDNVNFQDVCTYTDKMISPLEIMDYLQPIRSYFIPHDLVSFYHEHEISWLTLFDSILVPTDLITIPHHSIHNVGWIKRKTLPRPFASDDPLAIGFSLSGLSVFRILGLEASYHMLYPILSKNVSIKFPAWHETDKFENYFREKGVTVFPSTKTSSEFIDNNSIIITNLTSSVTAEAAYAGRSVLNIYTDHYAENLQWEELRHLPNVHFLSIDEAPNFIEKIQKGEILLKPEPAQIKPFDFDYVTKLITNQNSV